MIAFSVLTGPECRVNRFETVVLYCKQRPTLIPSILPKHAGGCTCIFPFDRQRACMIYVYIHISLRHDIIPRDE